MVSSARAVTAFAACLILTPAVVQAQQDRFPDERPDVAHPFDPYALRGQGSEDRGGQVLELRRHRLDLGPTVIGPGGVVPPRPPRKAEAPKPKPLTPAQRAEAIRKALAPLPPFAEIRRQTLDKLYAKLAKASDAEEAKGLATLIGNIWLRTGSDTAALLMQRAMTAAGHKDYSVALDLLDRVVELQPNWPEAWNKRASVRFQAGNVDGAMEDVEHVLKLDPNQFAALEGMGMILQHTGFDKRALQVYRRALQVYPHQPAIEEIVKTLSLQVEGQGI